MVRFLLPGLCCGQRGLHAARLQPTSQRSARRAPRRRGRSRRSHCSSSSSPPCVAGDVTAAVDPPADARAVPVRDPARDQGRRTRRRAADQPVVGDRCSDMAASSRMPGSVDAAASPSPRGGAGASPAADERRVRLFPVSLRGEPPAERVRAAGRDSAASFTDAAVRTYVPYRSNGPPSQRTPDVVIRHDLSLSPGRRLGTAAVQRDEVRHQAAVRALRPGSVPPSGVRPRAAPDQRSRPCLSARQSRGDIRFQQPRPAGLPRGSRSSTDGPFPTTVS